MFQHTIAPLLGAILLVSGAESQKPPGGKPQSVPPLELERTIPIRNIDGRLGAPVADIERRRIIVPAPVAGSVEVIDLNTGRAVKSIKGLQRPQSVAWHPEAARLYVTTRQDAGLSIYDAQYNLIRKVSLSASPDEVQVLPHSKRVIVALGNSIAIFDLEGQAVGSIRLEGPPSSFVVAPDGQRLWANLQTNKSVVIADLVSRVPVRSFAANAEMFAVSGEGRPANYSLSTGTNYGLALDVRGRRLMMITRKPSKLVVMDSESGNIRDARQTIADPENVWFDAASRHILITGNDSTIDVVRQVDPDHYEPVAHVPSAPGARTSLLLAESGKFYVAAPADGARPAGILVYSLSR